MFVHAAGASEGAAAPIGGSDALSRLGRGELSLETYLDARVAEATSHLEGKISLEGLDFVRRSLRDQLATDPVLVALVRRATGSPPGEPGR